MAYQKYRIRRKNDSGTYDILHVESQSNLIMRFTDQGAENGTVESALRDLETKTTNLQNTMDNLTGTGGGLSVKADKVASATSGNFAGLDANGNLTDSGKKASDFATSDHKHAADDITSGILPVSRGGTGAATAAVNTVFAAPSDAEGAPTFRKLVAADIPSLAASKITSGTLGVARGGTGKSTLTSGSYLVGAGTSAVALKTPAEVLSDIGAAASGHDHEGVYAPAGHNHDTVYAKSSLIGAASGIAPLGSDSKVPAAYLPSYVDDVVEGTLSTFPATGETGKIYVDTDTNKTYRWSGSAYAEISASLALGTTSSTAFAGDKGQIAYNHSQAEHARTDATLTEASSTNGKIKINGVETTVYTHPTGAGNNHIPSGGASGQILKYSASGTAVWADEYSYTHPSYTSRASNLYKITVNSNGHVSAATAATASDILGLGLVDISFAASQPTTQKANDLWFESIS